MTRPTRPHTILLRRHAALGDVLWVTPIVEALKRARPEARVHVQTAVPGILAGHPDIDGVNVLAPEEADEIHDLQYEFHPDRHILEGYARSTGLDLAPANPTVHLSAEEDLRGREILAGLKLSARPVIGLHAGVSWPERTWDWWKWDHLARRLTGELNLQVLALGRSPDFAPNPWPGLHSLVDRLTLRELLAVLKQVNLFVGLDSGPMHAAAAFRKPVVALFGCIRPEWRRPPESPFHPVTVDLPCLGCQARRPIPSTDGRCENGTIRCMRDITVDMVFESVRNALAESGFDASADSGPRDASLSTWIGADLKGSGHELIPSRTGAPTLRLSGNGREITLHSAIDPETEARRWAETIVARQDIVILGLGLGYHVREILQRPDRGRVAVVEADPAVFRHALAAGILDGHWDDPALYLAVADSPVQAMSKIKLIDPSAEFEPILHRPSLRWRPDFYQPLFDALNRKWTEHRG